MVVLRFLDGCGTQRLASHRTTHQRRECAGAAPNIHVPTRNGLDGIIDK